MSKGDRLRKENIQHYDALAYLSKAEKENDKEMREAFTKLSKEQREIIVNTKILEIGE